MRYAPIDSALFRANRERLTALLPPDSVAVLNASDVMPTSADGTLPFVQQTDLFYLTGIDQEETVLLLCPSAREARQRELLFLRETSESIARWEGERLTREAATARSGIASVHWTREFEHLFRPLAIAAETIYLNSNEHARAESPVETRDERFRRWCQAAFPLHRYGRLAPLLHRLRPVKQEAELEQIRRAIAITADAFRQLLLMIRPGVWEFELEAAIWHELLRRRSRRPAFAPIIAAGADSCVLHYVKNDKQLQADDLVLMDFGAEYANYAADVTRTVPVNGRFTPRQRQVYEAVLRVQRGAIRAMVPGATIEGVQQTSGGLMEGELVALGLLTPEQIAAQPPDAPLYKRWFMHGVSHHLGLDVHDYGDRLRPLEPGMVLTCEPGIYIREEGIGIRLENDILVTAEGPVDLCAEIPIEPDEIEALMQNRRA
jgi:Xaa-Pro aminopeptidase